MDFAVIARRWIFANAVVAVATSCWELADLPLRGWLSASNEYKREPWLSYVLASGVATAALGALYAKLTGPILRSIVPDLREHDWLIINVVFGSALGIWIGVTSVFPRIGYAVYDMLGSVGTAFAPFIYVLYAIGVGTITGAVQSLTLRRVAEGGRIWILMSAVAMGATAVMASADVPFLSTRGTLGAEVASQLTLLFGNLAGPILMLPALRRLRPRG